MVSGMDFHKQRKIVRRLEEKGKNPLLFLPCFIAKYIVIAFMTVCRLADMALSDKDGNFLGIKRKRRKSKNYEKEMAELQRRVEAEEAMRIKKAEEAAKAAQQETAPVNRDEFSEKQLKRLERRLSYRPMWQRAVSVVLAASFAVMTVPEMTVSAQVGGVVYRVPVVDIVTSQMVADAGGASGKAGISEVDFSSYANSGKPLKIEAGAFYNMPALTTVTMPALTLGYSIGANNFRNIAPNAAMFMSASDDQVYSTAASAFRNTGVTIIRDSSTIRSMIPGNVSSLSAYSAANAVLLEWPAASNADGYAIYTYTGAGANAVYKQVQNVLVNYANNGMVTAEIKASASSGDVMYAVRAYNTVEAGIVPGITGVTLYSKEFTCADKAVKPTVTGRPEIMSNMVNNTINLTISLPASADVPSYMILYSRADGDNTYYGSQTAVFYPSDFTNNSVSWSNSYPLDQIVQKFIAVAYYDMNNSHLSEMMNFYPEPTSNVYTNTAEFSFFRSNEIAITEAILAPPTGLTCNYQADRAHWALHWSYPESTNGLEGSIYYVITANGQVLDGYGVNDRYTDTFAYIKIDDPGIEPGENIIFSVTAVHDGMTSSPPASVSVDVKANCVDFKEANPGDERVTAVFKKYPGATRYVIWYRQEFISETGETVVSEAKSINVTEDKCLKNSDGTLSYIITNLTNDISYTFWITSPAALYRSVFRTATPSNAPAPPKKVTATVFENGAEINWDVVNKDGTDEPVDGYYLEVRARSGEVVLKNTQVAGKTTYTVTKLQNDVEYYAYVYSYILVDGNPIQSRTYTRSAAFMPTVTVDNVLNLMAVDSGTYIKLTWSAVKNATKYILYRTGEDGSSLELDMGNKTSYDDKAVRNNVLYTYRVRAVRTVDGKDYNGEISTPQTQKINVVLSPVQGLTATGIDGGVVLKWDKVAGADGYYVYYRSNTDGSVWTRAGTVGTNTFTHKGIPNGTTYIYCVIPYAIVNNETVPMPDDLSGLDVAQKVLGTAGLYLPAPSDFTATAGDGQVSLQWTAVKEADGYEIYIIGPNGLPYLYDNVSKTSVIHSGIANGTTITYTIRAYKFVDGVKVHGDYSVYKTVVVGTVLNAPTDVAAKSGDGQVTLSWKKVDGADGYVVYCYNSAGSSFTPVGIVTTTNFVHTGLVNGRTYTYMVAAYKNVSGEPQYSGYSLAVSAIPEGNGKNNNSNSSGGSSNDSNSGTSDYRIYITGTTPYGMSNSNLISAYAEKGAFNSDIDVRFTLSPDTVTAVQNILNFYGEGIDSFMVYPMDISLYLAGTDNKTFINQGYYLTLTIPVPDDLLPYSEGISVVHVSDAEQIEILPSVHVNVSGVDCIQFIANSFSPYAFVVYLPVLAEDMGAGTAAAAAGSVEYQTSASPVFLCTYLPELYRRRARNRVYRIFKK